MLIREVLAANPGFSTELAARLGPRRSEAEMRERRALLERAGLPPT